MMTRVENKDGVFVHASDIQLLDDEAMSLILDWKPDIVLASGPPLHLSGLSSHQRQQAWENGVNLVREVNTLILDHHLLRCEAGLRWLERLSSGTGRRVFCAAKFLGRSPCLLEAKRAQLYKEMPVYEV
jgi:predicted metallo-beta-lactamase superfamily hydrolase